jgi:hypothetical protein
VLAVAVAWAAAGSAAAQNVVQSDGNSNTAMGTNALASPGSVYGNLAAGEEALYRNSGSYNTALGGFVMNDNGAGSEDVGVGSGALNDNSSGGQDVAVGNSAMAFNDSGSLDTADGYKALMSNSSGSYNTASGAFALGSNTTANGNTAAGYAALFSNTTGIRNTASGYKSLYAAQASNNNTAMGFQVLAATTTGANNAAFGADALLANTTGNGNAAFGTNALYQATTGTQNVAVGANALNFNLAGSGNIAIGYAAGDLIGKNNNIDIGAPGEGADSGVIRIGSTKQTAIYIPSIGATHTTGAAVVLTSSGQLGVVSSSERYKTAIAPMGRSSEKLQKLRPVSFRLKDQPDGALQYGLIAEEVDQVYPELVIRDASDTIQGVRYDELAPMLLNEVQKLTQQRAQEQQEVAELRRENLEMRAAITRLEAAAGNSPGR